MAGAGGVAVSVVDVVDVVAVRHGVDVVAVRHGLVAARRPVLARMALVGGVGRVGALV
jgi:hypothetical protein